MFSESFNQYWRNLEQNEIFYSLNYTLNYYMLTIDRF